MTDGTLYCYTFVSIKKMHIQWLDMHISIIFHRTHAMHIDCHNTNCMQIPMTKKMLYEQNHEIDGMPNEWDTIEHPKRYNKFYLCGKKKSQARRAARVRCRLYTPSASATHNSIEHAMCTVLCATKTEPLKSIHIYELRRVVSSRTAWICALQCAVCIFTMEK